MTEIEYLKEHHSISEQTLGSVDLFLSQGEPEKAYKELKIGIAYLDKLSDHYSVNSTAHMIKVVLGSKDWRQEGSLFKSFQLGTRSLKEAFDIVQSQQ